MDGKVGGNIDFTFLQRCFRFFPSGFISYLRSYEITKSFYTNKWRFLKAEAKVGMGVHREGGHEVECQGEYYSVVVG